MLSRLQSSEILTGTGDGVFRECTRVESTSEDGENELSCDDPGASRDSVSGLGLSRHLMSSLVSINPASDKCFLAHFMRFVHCLRTQYRLQVGAAVEVAFRQNESLRHVIFYSSRPPPPPNTGNYYHTTTLSKL